MEMKELLKQGIAEALDKAIAAGTLPAGDYPAISLEVPPQKEFGDFATNIAMQSARIARRAPKMIAEAIVAQMDYPWLDRAEIAGAGFINFFLKHDVIYDTLKNILAAGAVTAKRRCVKKTRYRSNMSAPIRQVPFTSATAAAQRTAAPSSTCCAPPAATCRQNIISTTQAIR